MKKNIEIDKQPFYETLEEVTADPETVEEIEAAAGEEKPKNARKPRKTYTPEEAEIFLNNLNTSGRKGVHLKRINMAFKDDIYNYIYVMSRASGLTLTQFVNNEMEKSLERNRDLYQGILDMRIKLEYKGE